jgi:hypothetical protein
VYDGLVNGIDGVFKSSTSYHNKTIAWILFPNKKIGVFASKKSTHLYTYNIQPNWRSIEPIIKDIKIGESNNKNSSSNLISSNKNHSSIKRIIIR